VHDGVAKELLKCWDRIRLGADLGAAGRKVDGGAVVGHEPVVDAPKHVGDGSVDEQFVHDRIAQFAPRHPEELHVGPGKKAAWSPAEDE
jgi:hypothetical protein